MPFADDFRRDDAAARRKGIHRRINALFGDTAFEIDRAVQVRECGRRCWVGIIVRRNVNRLNTGYGTARGRCNSFLQFTHFGSQGWLITDGRGHTTQKRRYFRTRLSEAENIINEEQCVRTGLIAEMFGHGECRQRNAKSRARWFVHLAEHHNGLIDDPLAGVTNLRFLHFKPKVITFACALTNAREAGIAAVKTCESGDKLLNNNGLAYTGTAEQAGLTATNQRTKQVDDLDAGFEQLGLGGQIRHFRWSMVNGFAGGGCNRTQGVDWFPHQIEHATQCGLTNRNRNRLAGVSDGRTALQAVGGAQRDGAKPSAAQMLRDFAPQRFLLLLPQHDTLDIHFQRVV